MLMGFPAACHAKMPMSEVELTAILENSPQVQRAADQLVMEVLPSIKAAAWPSVKTALLKSDQDILQPISRISQSSSDAHLSAVAVDLKAGLQRLKVAAITGNSATALQAWNQSASLVNDVMTYANQARVENPASEIQEFTLATADPEQYLSNNWEAMVKAMEAEETFSNETEKLQDLQEQYTSLPAQG